MPMVIEVPDELKPLGEAVRALLQTTASRRGKALKEEGYAAVEEELMVRAAEVERQAHAAILSSYLTGAERLRIDGVEHVRVLTAETGYFTRAGEVRVTRGLYRPTGVRNAPVVDEVAVRVGAVEGVWLPHTATAMAGEMARGTSREAEAAARRLGVLPYSRSSFERVGHAVATQFQARQVEIEEQLVETMELPSNVASLSAALDRVSVAMEEPAERPRGRPRKGAPKRLVRCAWRMAWCATLTLHDSEGRPLHTIRYGRMPGADPEELCDGLAHDALVLLQRRPGLKIATLCDGAPDLRALLDKVFVEKVFGKVHRLVDFWHLAEKLGSAARLIHGAEKAEGVINRWKLGLLNGARQVSFIRGELERSGLRETRVGDTRPVHDALVYLANHAGLMNYAAARRAGLPIGSGNVEATCKSLFALRMKRPGARWKPQTGEDIVQLRALTLSDRFEPAIRLALAPLRGSVRRQRAAA